MKRNVKFLLHGEMVSGELIKKNKHTVYVRTNPCGKIFARRFKCHNIIIAPPGIEFSEDLKNLPKWYLSYQKFLEAKSKKQASKLIETGGVFSPVITLESIKKRAAEILLDRFETAKGI